MNWTDVVVVVATVLVYRIAKWAVVKWWRNR